MPMATEGAVSVGWGDLAAIDVVVASLDAAGNLLERFLFAEGCGSLLGFVWMSVRWSVSHERWS